MSTQNDTEKTDPGVVRLSDLANRERPADPGRAVAPVSGRHAAVTQVPASIVHAICLIKQTVESIKKSQRNQHGGYNFSSTDDFYAALTRKMGEVGLVLLALEDEAEVKRLENKDGKIVQWLRVTFSFVLATEKDTWSDERNRRTLFVQVTGPQTFQAAQSFAEKAYLRSLFKMPSGDLDLDAMPQELLDEEQAAPAKTKRKSSAAAKRDGYEDIFNDLIKQIKECETRDSLLVLRLDHMEPVSGKPWHKFPTAWAGLLEDDWMMKAKDMGLQLDGDA